jgi:uncharacterized protein HemX
LSFVRCARPLILGLLVLALAAPTAQAATTILTAPAQTAPRAPAFGPLTPLSTGTVDTQTQINSKRPDRGGLDQATLLLLVAVALSLIIGVGMVIWREGRKPRGAAKRRRQRMRSGRTPHAQAAAAAGRRGPPPPPRKRASAARRKKR